MDLQDNTITTSSARARRRARTRSTLWRLVIRDPVLAIGLLLWPVAVAGLLGIASYGSSIGVLPVGGIVLADATLGACPANFSEVTALRGVYPRGMTSGGTLGASVGTALTNVENRAAGQHQHQELRNGLQLYQVANAGTAQEIANGNANDSDASVTEHTDSGIGLVAGTNAPYYTVLFCKRTT